MKDEILRVLKELVPMLIGMWAVILGLGIPIVVVYAVAKMLLGVEG